MSTNLTHRRRAGIAALAALAAAAPSAAADGQTTGATSALCTSRLTATITPGFTTTPSTGTLTTHGQTGVISCVGKLRGHRITGPGSLGVNQTHTGATCQAAIGTGTVRVTIPTTSGMSHMVGALSVQRRGLLVHVEVRFPGARLRESGVAIPKDGDCLATPLRQTMVVLTGVLSGPRGT